MSVRQGMRRVAIVAAGAYWLGCAAWLVHDYPHKVAEAASEITTTAAADAAATAAPAKLKTPEEEEAFLREVLAYADAPPPPPSPQAKSLALKRTALDAGRFGLIFIAAVAVAGILRWVALGFLTSSRANT